MRRSVFAALAFLMSAAATIAPGWAQTTITTGTVQQLGPFGYYHFQSNDGTTVWGTSQALGPFTYYTLRSSDGAVTSGSSHSLGPFTHYHLRSTVTEGGQLTSSTTTGSSHELEPFTYFSFQSSDGSTASGSLQSLGTLDYWSLTQTAPEQPVGDPFDSNFDEE